MSFDLGIWYSEVPMSADEAGTYFQHINRDWVVVRRAAEVDAFLRDLLERFPDGWYPTPPPEGPDDPPENLLQSVAELRAAAAAPPADWVPPPYVHEPEGMVWAASPISAQGSTVTLSIRFGAVRHTAPAVHELAMRHGLVFYDPQDRYVALPPSLAGKTAPASPRQLLVLRIAGEAPNIGTTLLLDGEMQSTAILASRREAHAEARRLALTHRLDHYQVEDPASIGQSLRWEPIDGGGDASGPVTLQLKIVEPNE